MKTFQPAPDAVDQARSPENVYTGAKMQDRAGYLRLRPRRCRPGSEHRQAAAGGLPRIDCACYGNGPKWGSPGRGPEGLPRSDSSS